MGDRCDGLLSDRAHPATAKGAALT